MYYKPKHCPKCAETPEAWKASPMPLKVSSWYLKRGYYKTKHNGQPVPRYQCKRCRHLFSSHSLLPTYRQKKPAMNKEVYKWYSSGTTQRRMAINLGINRKTVARKFLYMARQAANYHKKMLSNGSLKTMNVQFDELEHYEHTIMKPVSIAVAVDTYSGKIISLDAATMKIHGKLTGMSRDKYGYREDTRDAAREDAFRAINDVALSGLKIYTDFNPSYPNFKDRFVPSAQLVQVYSKGGIKRSKKVRRNLDDALWRVNHVCAKIRNDLARLSRKSWVTTKALWALQAQLDLYIAYNNQYELV